MEEISIVFKRFITKSNSAAISLSVQIVKVQCSIAMVIECREANGNNSRCCHHDILSPGPRHILIISYFLCVIIPSNRCDLNFWVGLLNMLGFLHNRYYRQWSHSTMGTSPRYCLQWDRPLLLVGGDMLSYNTLPTQTRPSTIKKP